MMARPTPVCQDRSSQFALALPGNGHASGRDVGHGLTRFEHSAGATHVERRDCAAERGRDRRVAQRLFRARNLAPQTRDARLLLVAKHLERIGDYVTDISELTVYMAEAAIIKHQRGKQ